MAETSNGLAEQARCALRWGPACCIHKRDKAAIQTGKPRAEPCVGMAAILTGKPRDEPCDGMAAIQTGKPRAEPYVGIAQ